VVVHSGFEMEDEMQAKQKQRLRRDLVGSPIKDGQESSASDIPGTRSSKSEKWKDDDGGFGGYPRDHSIN